MSTNSRDEVVLEVQYLQTPAPSVQVLDPANQTLRLTAALDDICMYFSISCWWSESSSSDAMSPSLCSARRRTRSSVTTGGEKGRRNNTFTSLFSH